MTTERTPLERKVASFANGAAQLLLRAKPLIRLMEKGNVSGVDGWFFKLHKFVICLNSVSIAVSRLCYQGETQNHDPLLQGVSFIHNARLALSLCLTLSHIQSLTICDYFCR